MIKQCKLLLTVLVAAAVLFTACSGISEELKQPVSVNGASGVAAEPVSSTKGQAEEKSVSEQAADDTADEPVSSDVSISETVLYEANGIKVTATGYESGWMGPEVKVLVENDSTDNALITFDAVSVNGYMMPYSGFYAEVAAGKKANESLVLSASELKRSGIDTVAEIQFYLQHQDPETWDVLEETELLTLTTSAAPYEQPVDDSGDVLYDADGIKIVCKGLKHDVIWDGTVVFYMENTSGKAVSIYAENVSVNGFMQEVGLWSDLRDNTRLIDGMSMLDLSDLEIENVDQIENIEFSLRVVDADTWEDITTIDTLSLSFE